MLKMNIIKHHISAHIAKYLLAAGVMLTVTALTSCGDFLKEYSQDEDYVRTWTDLNELLIGDGYMPCNSSGGFYLFSNNGMFLHLFGDEMEENNFGSTIGAYNNHQPIYGYWTWAQRVGTKQDYTGYYQENQMWTEAYKHINVCNNVLNSVKDVPQTLDADVSGVNYVKGQAHFLRAFLYFWLTNVYGQPYSEATASTDLAVPIKTSAEVEDKFFTRNTVQECYSLIESDLLDAIQELSATTTARKSIYRADSVSAMLLLSRVYLYMQNWQKAAEYAKRVINAHPALMNLADNSSYFMTTTNPETIFSMGGDDLPSLQCCSYQCLRVSSGLYNSYSNYDYRRSQWYFTYGLFKGVTKQPKGESSLNYTQAQMDYYYAYYTENIAKHAISSLFWLRSGEAYLNYAEAEAYLGNEDEARKAINTLRENRIMSVDANRDLTSSGSQLITDIRNERRRELAFEGHRWFDLRRYRVCKVQPEKISITHNYSVYKETGSDQIAETRQFVLGKDDPSWTAPIPFEVLDFNVGMKGNSNLYRDYTIVPTVN